MNPEIPAYELFAAELNRFNRRVCWEMDMGLAITLCGLIQLALRHPDLQDQTASGDAARAHVEAFIKSIPDEFPAIKQTITAGFHT